MKVYKQESLSPAHEAILAMVPPGARVLEVGCATGHVTRALSDRLRCEVTAVELDLEQAEVAQPYARAMIVGDIGRQQTWDSIHGPFDCAVFADVLEHLVDPWEALRRCRAVLAGDGCVLASVPNIAYYRIRLELARGRFDYTDYGILDDAHLRFFTAKTARALFADSGYTVTDFIPIYRRRMAARIDRALGYPFAYQFVIRAVPVWNP
jgi:2-polyprenyl-3-methyl-5-hydroxy-6-metoxy-1,4-benzoquinol methylase